MPRNDIHKDGVNTRFSSENQPANNGRRQNGFSRYIKEERVSLDDIRALISSIFEYTQPEIETMLKDKVNKPPIVVMLLLKAMLADMKKGDTKNFDKLVDRVHGRPTQMVNVESPGLSVAMMTPEERDKRIAEFLKNGEHKKPVKKS